MVTASAPGKMVLFGDHAVVYRRPCLVTAVDIRYRVTMEQSDGAFIEINTPELQQRGEVRQVAVEAIHRLDAAATVFVEAAIAQVFQRYRQSTGLKIATCPFFKSVMRYYSALLCKTLHMLSFFLKKAQRNKQGKICVFYSC